MVRDLRVVAVWSSGKDFSGKEKNTDAPKVKSRTLFNYHLQVRFLPLVFKSNAPVKFRGTFLKNMQKPNKKDYGYQEALGFDSESGWMLEGGEEAYFEALKKYNLFQAAPEMLEALEILFAACTEYVNYKHNGDPTIEDARTMGEMEINDLYRDGLFDEIALLIKKAKGK